MLRARFRASKEDYRPVNWPIKHPYWCSGFGDNYSIIVAYADSTDEILANWPEATHLTSEDCESYSFTDRFPKPEWFDLNNKEGDRR